MFTEDININTKITISQNDITNYINQRFINKYGDVAECIGIYSVRANSKKMYVLEFVEGQHKGKRTIADSYAMKNGIFYPKPFRKNNPQDTIKRLVSENNIRTVGTIDYSNHKDLEQEKYIKQLEKQVQNLMDKNRILRKNKRHENRNDIIMEEFMDKVSKHLGELHNTSFVYPTKIQHAKETMIVQLSDLHFGKVVNLQNNKFNFDVAEARLNTYAREIEDIANKYEIKEMIICFTGDLFNLDSHLDTLLSNESNRAVNFIKGIDILTNFIKRLGNKYRLSFVGIVGNESRIRAYEDQSNIDEVSSNNFDYIAFQTLSRIFPGIPKLNECNTLKHVFEVNGKNIGIFHGDKINKHTREELTKQSVSLYELSGKYIDYMIFGHIHEYLITATFARSGSLVGADNYAQNQLNIINSKASQNVFLVSQAGIRPIPIILNFI